jgi:hypothetical protein
VTLLSDQDPARRESTVAEFTADRYPILAFGGNAAPTWLTAKLGHFPAREDRDVLVLAGELHDIDVGASASPSPMGNMPGTLFASPGTAVRATMIWCTTAQITQLTWTEIPYLLGRLDDAVFTMDEADIEVEEVFAYVSRFGAFCVDEAPIALAAIPARPHGGGTDPGGAARPDRHAGDRPRSSSRGPDACRLGGHGRRHRQSGRDRLAPLAAAAGTLDQVPGSFPVGGGKRAPPPNYWRMNGIGLDKLEEIAEGLSLAFYLLMLISVITLLAGSAGQGFLLLLAGAVAHVGRAGIDEFVAQSRGSESRARARRVKLGD